MAHVRKQIRDRLVTTLKAGVSLVSQRVYPTRFYALTSSELPAITVSTVAETSSMATIGTKTMMRNASVAVDVYVRATSNVDDGLDEIAVQVEEAIAGDFTINGLAKDAVLQSTDIDFSGDAEQPIAVGRLTFLVRYITAIDDVETAR
jgi:hypothetical protein